MDFNLVRSFRQVAEGLILECPTLSFNDHAYNARVWEIAGVVNHNQPEPVGAGLLR
jgi:hypothetical protein